MLMFLNFCSFHEIIAAALYFQITSTRIITIKFHPFGEISDFDIFEVSLVTVAS